MIKNKKQMFTIISVFALVILLGTISYAFFNYTRTGVANTIKVGRIYFNTTQDNTINLTNVFPTDSNHLDNTNSATVTINITGDTEYSEGIEYKVSIVDVQNVVNGKEVPISYSVSTTNLGTSSNDYYNDRGSTTNVYNLRENGIATDGEDILIGYIKSDNIGVNGSINITAYLDKNKIGISDTVSRIENNNLVYGETDGEWIAGRTILTTTEWNGLQTNGVSFKVKVEANEGIWVEEPKTLVLKNLGLMIEWYNIKNNISSIEFSINGEIPDNAITSFDVTDITSDGPVTIYTIDDGLENNTYKAVIVADDVIYAPEDSGTLFFGMKKLVTFNSENFRVDNVTSMQYMFYQCTKLENFSTLSAWNTSSVTNMEAMFSNCTSLESLDFLIDWNVYNVETMSQMFNKCSNITNLNGLINWNTSNVQTMEFMFSNCTSLTNVDGLKNWNTSNLTNTHLMFSDCSSLTYVDLSSWNMLNVTNNTAMFEDAGFTTIKMPNNYTRIDNFMFNHNTSYNSDSFTIPKSVTSVGFSHIFYDFGKDSTFKRFIVENGSTSFKTVDDVLYTYDGTRLISIPREKTFTNNTYEMPEGVTSLNVMSFSRTQKIDKVVLANSYVIERWYDDTSSGDNDPVKGNSLATAIYVYTSVKEYEVKNDNPRYSSDSGCIYSKDGTELIAVPVHYTGVLNIKNGTTTIGQEAFWVQRKSSIDSITQINIPASVTTIEANQLTTLNSLMSRSTNPITITIDSGNTAYEIVNNQIVAK